MSAIKGIDVAVVTGWLETNLAGLPAPYTFELVAAGGSNLTYIVTAANSERFVLRRPPVRARIATAHDMHREYRIMSALAVHAYPVPDMLAYCDDESVNGADFYCMEMIDGLILRDQASAAAMSAAHCLRATESLIDAQVVLHKIDLDKVGLADLSRHEGYLQRQLRRWQKQVNAGKTRDVTLFDQLHDTLSHSVPAAIVKPGLAHGDYRFDNVVLNDNYQVAAVLDWELCTIGDPVADFVWSLCYWAQADEELTWLLSPPTKNPLFPDRDTVVAMYVERMGITLGDISWHTAFSWWKQACIVEGVYSRMQKGATGGMKIENLDVLGQRVINYLERAHSLL